MRQAWVPMKCGKSSLSMTAHFELDGVKLESGQHRASPGHRDAFHAEESPMAGQFGIGETYAGWRAAGPTATSAAACATSWVLEHDRADVPVRVVRQYRPGKRQY